MNYIVVSKDTSRFDIFSTVRLVIWHPMLHIFHRLLLDETSYRGNSSVQQKV